MRRNLALSFTLACVNKHRIEVDETEGQRLNGTACQECGEPMLMARMNVVGMATLPAPQRCPVHSDGDPCCWRQNGWVSSIRKEVSA